MKHNLHIIARDIPVFREVAGNSASYFLGVTGHILAKTVQNTISLNIQKNENQKYSWLTWRESAQKIKNILHHKQDTHMITKRPFKQSFNLAKIAAGDNITDTNFLLVKENNKLYKKTRKLKNKNHQLKIQLQNKSNEIETINNLYNSSKEEVISLTTEMGNINLAIKEKNQKEHEQSTEIIEKQKHIDELEDTIYLKESEIEASNQRVQNLEQELTNQDKYKNDKNK